MIAPGIKEPWDISPRALDMLLAELEDTQRLYDSGRGALHADIWAATKTIRALRSALTASEKDAERWRRLRMRGFSLDGHFFILDMADNKADSL